MQVTLIASILLASVVAVQVSGRANPCSMKYGGGRDNFELVLDYPKDPEWDWTDCCLTFGSNFHYDNATVGTVYKGSCAHDPMITSDMPDVCEKLTTMKRFVPGLPELTGESL